MYIYIYIERERDYCLNVACVETKQNIEKQTYLTAFFFAAAATRAASMTVFIVSWVSLTWGVAHRVSSKIEKYDLIYKPYKVCKTEARPSKTQKKINMFLNTSEGLGRRGVVLKHGNSSQKEPRASSSYALTCAYKVYYVALYHIIFYY